MFPKLTRHPAALPALFITSLLLIWPVTAQEKKGDPVRPGPGIGVGDAPGVGPYSPGPALGPDRVFRQTEVTRKAVLLSKPEPGYTEEARLNDVEGVVRLRAVLASSGQVTNISVIKPLPDGLTEKAIAAARQIRFRPAEKDGRTVSQYIVLEYNFNIYEDEDKVARKAVILEKPAPEYTEEARAQKVEGKVVLEVFLHRSGTARPGQVVEGLPHGLTEKAIEAASKIRFKPAEDQGRPVSVYRQIEFAFSLK